MKQYLNNLGKRGYHFSEFAKKFIYENPEIGEKLELILTNDNQKITQIISIDDIRRILVDDDLKKRALTNSDYNITENLEKDIQYSRKKIELEGDYISGITSLIRDRYNKLKQKYESNYSEIEFKKINDIETGPGSFQIKNLIVKVNLIQKTDRGYILKLEDDTGPITGYMDLGIYSKKIIKDTIIAINGVIIKKINPVIKIKKIFELKVEKVRDEPTSHIGKKILIISDVHFGSKYFHHQSWKNFLLWINHQTEYNIDLLIIVGDLVEGVGVFPHQKKEIDILDINTQYKFLAEEIKKIPSKIQILVCPGNHDIVRLAEPQPAIPKEFISFFGKNVSFVPNPFYFEYDQRKILLYHGRGFNQWIDDLEIDHTDPISAQKYMIDNQHISPVIGEKNYIFPTKTDELVINESPDLFLTGHTHVFRYEKYKGIHLLNVSTFQDMTGFQKKFGIFPDVGGAVIYDTKQNKIYLKKFLPN